jgi:hypothetical protein
MACKLDTFTFLNFNIVLFRPRSLSVLYTCGFLTIEFCAFRIFHEITGSALLNLNVPNCIKLGVQIMKLFVV